MSPKPWAKVEVGRMRHRKFLALSGNAIALWDEIKDYCDEHLTDGIVPAEAFKTFRFAGKKSMEMLTTSCGPKPDGTAYAPLLEVHPLGWSMHDFLDHNDCREAAMTRIEQAARDRKLDRNYKAAARAVKKAKHEEVLSGAAVANVRSDVRPDKPDASGACPPNVRLYTESATATPEIPKNGISGRSAETASVSPVALKFPTDGDPSQWPLTEQQITDWSTLYPSIDVLAECRKASAWIDADPKRRKTAGGMRRFLVNWLNNATNRPHAVSGQAGSRTSGNAAALQRFAARAVNHD